MKIIFLLTTKQLYLDSCVSMLKGKRQLCKGSMYVLYLMALWSLPHHYFIYPYHNFVIILLLHIFALLSLHLVLHLVVSHCLLPYLFISKCV